MPDDNKSDHGEEQQHETKDTTSHKNEESHIEEDDGSAKHDSNEVSENEAQESEQDSADESSQQEDDNESTESKDANSNDEEAGNKRKRPKASQGSSKKQKTSSKANGTHGSKHDKADAPAPQGSNDRLPKKGQRVSWKAMPGWVHGKVIEIVTDDKDMKGKHIKASKDAPRIALEAESGKFCVHKPDNCYFEDE